MMKNQYTETINHIRAPKASVDKAVLAALEADKSKKVINIQEVKDTPKQKTKRRVLRIISAAAACAVLITGITIAGTMTQKHKNGSVHNGFSLVANATKLEKGSSVEILSVQGHAPSGRFSMEKDGKNAYAFMEEYLSFAVECRGEDIQTVNYSVNNGVFYLGPWQTVLEEGSVSCEKYTFMAGGDAAKTVPADQNLINRRDEEPPRAYDTGSGVELTGNNLYTAYTVPFDKQNMISPIALEAAKVQNDDPDGKDIKADYPSCMIATFLTTNDKTLSRQVKDAMVNYSKSIADEPELKVAYAEYVMAEYEKAEARGESEPSDLLEYEDFIKQYDGSIDSSEQDKVFKIFYDALINDITVDVTVTYLDGTTETDTIQLSCEKVENGIVTVGAKLV